MHVVTDRNGCSLHTLAFGCLEWESELYGVIMRARCYPFKMQGNHHKVMTWISMT